MIIKSSYADCGSCRLLNESSCILETNIKNDEQCDIIFIAENPGKNEVNNIPPTPLIGKSGEIFRDPFNSHIKNNFKWVITNSVLCLTLKPDGTTGNATIEDADKCKPNLQKLIEICKPKLVVGLGTVAMYTMGLGKDKILSKTYKFHIVDNQVIYLLPHPSYILRNGGPSGDEGTKYKNGFLEVKKYLGEDHPKELLNIDAVEIVQEEIKPGKKNTMSKKMDKKEGMKPVQYNVANKAYSFKIDQDFYTDKYRLEDIQYSMNNERVLYIFRDTNNKKIYHELPKIDNNYYYYKSASTENKIIEPVSNLELVLCNYNSGRSKASNCYESDVEMSARHAVDYYLQNQGEAPTIKQNILFTDIEVYTFDSKAFPFPEKAEHPISLITFCLDDSDLETYLYKIPNRIDPKIDEFLLKNKDMKITVFNSEKVMLDTFAKRIHQLEPTFITAWNVSFDIGYIYNRMKNIGLNPRILSKYDDCFVDTHTHICIISGYVVLDMMTLYKSLRQNKEDSYSLQAVSQKVLGRGKHEYTGTIFDAYEKDIENFIIYNRDDVQLICEINEKLRHIQMMDELRRTSCCSWKGASSTLGQCENLFLTNLKKRDLVAKSKKEVKKLPGEEEDASVAGAYVKDPVGGKYEDIIDFDYEALYPNNTRTFNIGPNTYVAKIDEVVAFDIIYKRETLNLEDTISYIIDPIGICDKKSCKIKDIIYFIEKKGYILNISGCIFKGHEEEKSIFFEIYNFLLEDRKAIKKLKFNSTDEVEKQIYDNKQWALKILANSMYGALLNKHFRFYNQDLGYSITATGQEAIKFAGYHLNDYMETGKFEIDVRFASKINDNLKYLLYVDTDSLFIKIGDFIRDKYKEAPTIENIKKYVTELDTVVNKDIMKQFCDLHYINNNFRYLKLKQEIIADKAYFLQAKKRYCLHVVNREGYSCDEIDIKGIETQRSDFSKLTKIMLQTIIDKILLSDEVDVDDILNYVEQVKDEFRKLAEKGDKSIGKPVSFTKELKSYKTLSKGVKSMLYWNSLVYQTFEPGSKGLEFPIKCINFSKAPDYVKENYREKDYIVGVDGKTISMGKLTSIAIPDSEERLPDYFEVDIKELLRFAVDDRVELLVSPLFSRYTGLLQF